MQVASGGLISGQRVILNIKIWNMLCSKGSVHYLSIRGFGKKVGMQKKWRKLGGQKRHVLRYFKRFFLSNLNFMNIAKSNKKFLKYFLGDVNIDDKSSPNFTFMRPIRFWDPKYGSFSSFAFFFYRNKFLSGTPDSKWWTFPENSHRNRIE